MRSGTWVLGRVLGRAQGRASGDGGAFCQSPVVCSRNRGTEGSSDCEEARAHQLRGAGGERARQLRGAGGVGWDHHRSTLGSCCVPQSQVCRTHPSDSLIAHSYFKIFKKAVHECGGLGCTHWALCDQAQAPSAESQHLRRISAGKEGRK